MIYFDNAATSFPKPKGVAEAMMGHMNAWCGNPGRAGHMFSRKTGEAVERTRQCLAELIGAGNPDRILYTSNTTEALNLAIQGTLMEGDHVITTAMEHNAVLRTLAASRLQTTVVPCHIDGSLNPEDVEQEIRSNTRMLICTMASNVTGTIMPVRELSEICSRHNILFVVDAAQALGHIPVNVDGIDLLAAPGHKGLMGPMGTGFLYTAEHVKIKPIMYGGTGRLSKIMKPEIEFPSSFETGTVNAPGIIGLGASLDWIRKNGLKNICRYQQELIENLDQELRNMKAVTVFGPADCREKVGIVTINIEGKDCEDVASLLNDEFGIAVRAGFHCAPFAHKTIGTWDTGAVRISVGAFNTMRQINILIDAIHRISGAHPSQYLPARPHGCSVR